MEPTSHPPTTPAAATCPVCGTPVIPTEARLCERCDTPHHADCWEYAGGCAIFGCARECASHSRESSLSSPSSSSPVPPTFHRWLWLYRLYAHALTVVGLGVATLAGAPVVGYLFLGLVTATGLDLGYMPDGGLDLLFAYAWMTLALAVFAAALVMAATFVPALLLRRHAEASLALGLALPRENVRPVLDRLDTSPSSLLLLRILRVLSPLATVFCYLAAGLLAAGLFLLYAAGPSSGYIGLWLIPLGLSGLLFASPLTAARDRMAWVETLQNRLAASFKSRKSS